MRRRFGASTDENQNFQSVRGESPWRDAFGEIDMESLFYFGATES